MADVAGRRMRRLGMTSRLLTGEPHLNLGIGTKRFERTCIYIKYIIPRIYILRRVNCFIVSSMFYICDILGISLPGAVDPDLERLARTRKSKSGRARGQNASRDFHRWVHRAGKTFQVHIWRKVNTDTVMMHSVIHLSSWLEAVMQTFPDFFLGGYSFMDDHLWMKMFGDFWKHFRSVCPSHPIYSKTEAERSCTIPFAIHGDEGRGLSKVPLMVISFQVLIPSSGPENLSGTQCLGACGWTFCGVCQ